MEFLIWMAVGIALMAVELVVPGGILGLIGYCTFPWRRNGSAVCRTRIDGLANCPYHRVL